MTDHDVMQESADRLKEATWALNQATYVHNRAVMRLNTERQRRERAGQVKWSYLVSVVILGVILVAILAVVFANCAPDDGMLQYVLAGVAVVGIVTAATLVWKVAPASVVRSDD